MSVNRIKSLAGITIPDSVIATQATELLLEHGTEFIYNHSLKVVLFSSLNGKRANFKYDAELLYVSSVCQRGFKQGIIPTFFSGFADKTDTTFGNIKADVCAYMHPDFKRENFCDCILHSPWSE